MSIPAITKSDASDKVRQVLQNLDKRSGSFVDRGDPASFDFAVGDLTADDTWRDLDLSSIIGTNIKAVLLKVGISNDTANEYVRFREKGNSNIINSSNVIIQLANISIAFDIVVAPDNNGIIQYQLDNDGTWSNVNIIVKGWWS